MTHEISLPQQQKRLGPVTPISFTTGWDFLLLGVPLLFVKKRPFMIGRPPEVKKQLNKGNQSQITRPWKGFPANPSPPVMDSLYVGPAIPQEHLSRHSPIARSSRQNSLYRWDYWSHYILALFWALLTKTAMCSCRRSVKATAELFHASQKAGWRLSLFEGAAWSVSLLYQ